MKPRSEQVIRALFASVALMLAHGCGSIADSLSGTYTGPAPSRDDITAEIAIIRTVDAQPGTGIQSFYMDRERFLTTAPHDINRVVLVTARDVQPTATQLNLKIGDRVRISTKFISYSEAGDLSRYVPDWPYDRYNEYPLGFHALTFIERVGG